MKSHSILRFVPALFAALLIWACDESEKETYKPQTGDICIYLDTADISTARPAINEFLNTLDDHDPQALDKLVNWLAGMPCVQEVKILCDSCIETLPVQSEIRIRYESAGETIESIMDISMDVKLRFIDIH